MKTRIRAACGICMAAAFIAPASASATTLDGECSVTGAATFTTPITAVPALGGGFAFSGDAVCLGALNGVTIDASQKVKARITQPAATALSCAAGSSSAGQGSLRFIKGLDDETRTVEEAKTDPADIVLNITVVHVSAGTEVLLRIQGTAGGIQSGGTAGGLAVGTATFRDSAGPETVSACAGTGVGALDFSAEVRILKTLVST